MLEHIEKLKDLNKSEQKEIVEDLRNQLVEVQQQLRKYDFPVLVLFAGVDGAGKHETVDLLNAWMDPRWLITHAFGEPSEEELQRPEYWRYWRDLPPDGQIGLYLSAWYSRPLVDRVGEQIDETQFLREIERINALERTLTDNGALILKFYMLLNKEGQEKRLKTLASHRLTRWQVKASDWENWVNYDRFMEVCDEMLTGTHTENAPWHLIDASAERKRAVVVAETILQATKEHMKREGQHKHRHSKKVASEEMKRVQVSNVLDQLDMDRAVSKKEYKSELKELSARLGNLQREAYKQQISAVAMFEGWDAAGKGGAIRRITGAMDARHYQVIPIAAPTDEEKRHHYLWRFWRHLPRAGRVTLFDRSWYGRVLVERIEGFATKEEWSRSYNEINEFESELTEHGIVLCKFWVHITKDEQLKRFKEREVTQYKKWKLTDEDWRNREQWDVYKQAVHDMVAHTNKPEAPWVMVEGNQKYYARLKILRHVCERMEQAIETRRQSRHPWHH